MLTKNITSIINKLESLITEISDQTISEIILEKQPIETKLQIIESLVKKSPIHIKAYDNLLISVTSKEKCKNCQRDASYIIMGRETDKFCWIHAQRL